MEKLLNSVYIFCITVVLFVACTNDGDVATARQEQPDRVEFSPYLQKSKTATRATYPAAAAVGEIDNDRLKTLHFGVFAQHTGNTAWGSYAQGSNSFNFMWNQEVTWSDELAGNVTQWTYSPVKYWPNDNLRADDEGAEGSQEYSYLSFFAYAPYAAADNAAAGCDHTGTATDDGIVQVTGNAANISGSYLYYRTSTATPFHAEECVDLLWAVPRKDLFKMKGTLEGYTTGTVDLVFKHALSLFTITVQGLFDHASNDDTSTLYPDDRDIFTRILVESVDFNGSPLFKEGKMYLAPTPVDATVPHWEVNEEVEGIIDLSGENICPEIYNRYLDGEWKKYWDHETPANSFLQLSDQDDDGDTDQDDALALFNQLPEGVSHTEVPLNYTAYDEETDTYDDYWYMVLPNKEYRDAHPDEKLTLKMVYYVITYDERLTLVKTGYPMYFNIVKNEVTATFDRFSFEPNKKYKLRLQPGLTSAKFEVTMVDGWDTPLTLDPIVVDWYTTPIEYDVE